MQPQAAHGKTGEDVAQHHLDWDSPSRNLPQPRALPLDITSRSQHDQSEQLITLTPEQLTEVCVRFAVFMGWTAGPTSAEWLMDVKKQVRGSSMNN